MKGIAMPDQSHAYALVAGARFYAWPVYLHKEDNRLYYEAEGSYLVRIGENEEAMIAFTNAEDMEIAAALVERLGRAE